MTCKYLAQRQCRKAAVRFHAAKLGAAGEGLDQAVEGIGDRAHHRSFIRRQIVRIVVPHEAVRTDATLPVPRPVAIHLDVSHPPRDHHLQNAGQRVGRHGDEELQPAVVNVKGPDRLRLIALTLSFVEPAVRKRLGSGPLRPAQRWLPAT
jgi:hypothetical protein